MEGEEPLKAVKELLTETAEGDLASVCSWPGEIKWMYKRGGPTSCIMLTPLISDKLTEALMFLSHYIGDVH
ncbi:hypothetical protein M8C21_031111, partial [Ambrosia artemisiifolia]